MRRLRPHLTYANVMVTLLAIGALTGGVAYAANTIGSSDIINGQVKSPDIGTGQVQSVDVRDDTLANGGLTGADIADQSGVDTCVSTIRIGQLCVRAENLHRTWNPAFEHCANLGLRMPSFAEAKELAQTHDIPNVDEGEWFWTESLMPNAAHDGFTAFAVNDESTSSNDFLSDLNETVCVTNPTN